MLVVGRLQSAEKFRRVQHLETAMTSEESQEVDRIVEQMKHEKGWTKFADLLPQFNEMINRKSE